MLHDVHEATRILLHWNMPTVVHQLILRERFSSLFELLHNLHHAELGKESDRVPRRHTTPAVHGSFQGGHQNIRESQCNRTPVADDVRMVLSWRPCTTSTGCWMLPYAGSS